MVQTLSSYVASVGVAGVNRCLVSCTALGRIIESSEQVSQGTIRGRGHFNVTRHSCVFEQLGDGIVNLPKEERAKFSLVAVGPDMMRRLVDDAG